MINRILNFFITFIGVSFLLFQSGSTLTVGSRSAVSAQSFVQFPASDNNNSIVGFVSLEGGFALEDASTTCTFQGNVPIPGSVDLRGGGLFLSRDFVMSNSGASLSGGVLFGKNHSLKTPASRTDFLLPKNPCFFVQKSGSINMGNTVYSVDWSMNDDYIVAVSDEVVSDREIKLGYFNGNTVTTTLSLEFTNTFYQVRWSPKKRFFAVAMRDISGNDFNVYEHRIYNGTLALVGGDLATGSVYSVAWHPSGNYFVVGTDNTSQEIITVPVNANGSTGTKIVTDLSSNQAVLSLSFAPGGNKMAAGAANSATVNISELYIYNFNGSLTLTTSLDIGATVNTVDWSPTGTYVAAGLLTTSDSLRIYDTSATQVKEVFSARQNVGQSVYGVAWDKTGTYLAVGAGTGITGRLYIYSFDKTLGTLTQIYSLASDGTVYDVRWSHDGNYVAYSGRSGVQRQAYVLKTTFAGTCGMRIDKTNIICNANTQITGPVHFSGTCKMSGQGRRILFGDQGAIIVRPNSSLILEDIEFDKVKGFNIRCLTNTASITLRNCIVALERDFTFSQGSILFERNVAITGTNKFSYTSRLGSTIGSDSTLFLTGGITFSYAPMRPNQTLIFMTDKTSQLYLDGCTLHSTRTGLHLSGGALIFDDKVTLSSEAKYTAESLRLNSNLDVVVRAGAHVEMFGSVRYL